MTEYKWATKGAGGPRGPNKRHLFRSLNKFATGDAVCGRHAFDATKDWMDWNSITPKCGKCLQLTGAPDVPHKD